MIRMRLLCSAPPVPLKAVFCTTRRLLMRSSPPLHTAKREGNAPLADASSKSGKTGPPSSSAGSPTTASSFSSSSSSQSSSSSSTTSSWFTAHRAQTLENLRTNQNDKSNAGGVDPLIVPVVTLINSFPHYITSSSCSGRVSVFHRALPDASTTLTATTASAAEGQREREGDGEEERAHEEEADGLRTLLSKVGAESGTGTGSKLAPPRMKRGWGLGTVFSSHDPVKDCWATAGAIYDELVAAGIPRLHRGGAGVGQTGAPSALSGGTSTGGDELLQFKFEPTIIHAVCASLDDAHRLMAAASQSGHRQVGIALSPLARGAPLRAGDAGWNMDPFLRDDDGPLLMASSAADGDATTIHHANKLKNKNKKGSSSKFKRRREVLEWKITAKFTSMISFDAPLYANTVGWTVIPSPTTATSPSAISLMSSDADDADPAFQQLSPWSREQLHTSSLFTQAPPLVLSLFRLLRHSNHLFEENIRRRERFIAELKRLEGIE